VAVQLDDAEIAVLLSEENPLPPNYRELVRTKSKTGHKERELEVTGANGSKFRIILRQSNFNPLDFSAILAYQPPKSSQLFRLRRYGKSHSHTNVLEKRTFYDFHIHKATARYQRESGLREDSFAEVTGRYADFQGALDCLLADCGFVLPINPQSSLLF